MKIGFIGLGRMGGHVAANLLKAGHSVTVWNRSQEPVAALVAKGAVAAAAWVRTRGPGIYDMQDVLGFRQA